jgi:iron complex outermembrane receptor protein
MPASMALVALLVMVLDPTGVRAKEPAAGDDPTPPPLPQEAAQEGKADRGRFGEEIEVVGSRNASANATKQDVPVRDVPQDIQVRNRQILDDLGGKATSHEVARTVAGVLDVENGQGDPGRNVPNFTFRGFANNGSYLWDGHVVNGWMSTTDMSSVERVEFLKGPASVLYGASIYPGDIGGVVNYVSKVPQRERSAAAELTGGSFGFLRFTADAGSRVDGAGRVGLRLSGALEHGDSWRDYAWHDAAHLAPAAELRLGARDTLHLLGDATWAREVPERGLPIDPESLSLRPSINPIDPAFSKTEIEAQRLALRYAHDFGAGWRLALEPSWIRSRTDQHASYLIFYPEDATQVPPVPATWAIAGSHWKLANYQLDVDVRVEGRAATGPLQHRLLVGYDHQRNRYRAHSDNGWNDPSVDVGSSLGMLQWPQVGTVKGAWDQAAAAGLQPGTFRWDSDVDAVYAQDFVDIGAGVKVLLGGRYDWIRQQTTWAGSFGDSTQVDRTQHLSPRAGAVWQPFRPTSVYAVYSESFSPNTGLTLDGSRPPPDLGRLFEIGLKQEIGAGFRMDLALYELQRTNMTFSDPADPTGNAVLVAGKMRSHGIELDVNGEPLLGLRINLTATVLRAWVAEGDPGGNLVPGSEFAGVPRAAANLLAVYGFGEGRRFEVGWGISWTGPAWADNANTFKVPAFLQLDALAAWRLSRNFRLQVNLKNLADRVNYTSNGWGWINVGDPFSAYATLRAEI